jgi:hypothetical protein
LGGRSQNWEAVAHRREQNGFLPLPLHLLPQFWQNIGGNAHVRQRFALMSFAPPHPHKLGWRPLNRPAISAYTHLRLVLVTALCD